jgi:predicted enzyme related to lactoylglutathione lyase
VRTLATINLCASDVREAAEWYRTVLGVDPWLVTPDRATPADVQFRVGDCPDEFGIIDRRWAAPGLWQRGGGPAVFWHVDDVSATFERLLSLGAVAHSPVEIRPTGLTTAAVVDPFGNIVGVMRDPGLVDTAWAG